MGALGVCLGFKLTMYVVIVSTLFVLAGTVGLRHAAGLDRLGAGDACVVPAGLPYSLEDPSDDFELLSIGVV